MYIGFYIASAAGWDERRREPLKRLQEQVPQAITIVSETREHSSVWSKRLYARALASPHSHHVFLNDDVIVCPNFEAVIQRIVSFVPDKTMSFATICPEVSTGQIGPGERVIGCWLRSYLLSGPGYLYPTALLASLVEFYEKLPRTMREKMNEDEVASHHAWSLQQPIWQTLVSLVQHDTDVPSTLGYDHHRGRVSTAPFANARAIDYDWQPDGEPPLVPHPWLSPGHMNAVRVAMSAASDPTACGYCAQRPGFFVSDMTGAKICTVCIRDIVGHVFNNLRAG